ncbi:MAG: dephospho-CoA kinase [Pyrinomonadaceae bacterium]|nr:dephospho-CoA kinase [Pyrinomonadaceae bacterium]
MLRVGLTGSIAVGKSYVSAVLAELGCHVLDADATAREVVAQGTPGLKKIVETFGEMVLLADGTLDRAGLGAIIFADEKQRGLLNSILHPFIIVAQDEQLSLWESEDPRGVGVIDAALMIESGGYKRFDKLIVVHCDPEVQLARLMARNNLTREEAQSRVAAQMPQAEKMRYADFLIDNSGDLPATRLRTEEVYKELRALGELQATGTR